MSARHARAAAGIIVGIVGLSGCATTTAPDGSDTQVIILRELPSHQVDARADIPAYQPIQEPQ